MTEKGQVPEVAVVAIFDTPDVPLAAHMRWAGAPGIEFELQVAPDGRLASWTARAGPEGAITARLLRSAPLGAMERAARRSLAESIAATRASIEGGQWEIVDEELGRFRPETPAEIAEHLKEHEQRNRWRTDFLERPRTGPAGRSDASYAALAALYVEALDRGETHPVRSVAGHLCLGEKTIRNYLFKARERGLLTSLGRGKAGGQLTDKAKEILDGHHQAP